MRTALAQRLPFYYGWVIAWITGISGAFVSGVTSWGLGIFVTPMQDEFGWSRTLFFLPLAIGALTAAVAGPLFGPMMDRRHGAQIWFAIGVVAFSTALISMRYVDSFVYYLVMYGVVGGIGLFGLFATRAVLPKWFIRRRGRALALAGAVTSLGALVFPPALQLMVGTIGWRDTWMAIGLVFAALMIPSIVLFERSPEDLGLYPDGETANAASAGAPERRPTTTEVSFTRSEAMRTVQFWLLITAVVAGTIAIRGIIPNIQPMFVERGLPATTASFSFSVYAVVTMAAAFGWGAIADRRGARAPFIALAIVMGTSMGLLWLVDTTLVMFVAMAYLGLGVNPYFILGSLFVANSFGRAHYGAISGLFQPFNNAATYGGPLVFGIIYDLSNGSYETLLAAALGLWVVTLGAAYFVRPLRWPVAAGTASG
jgi:MFS family permease